MEGVGVVEKAEVAGNQGDAVPRKGGSDRCGGAAVDARHTAVGPGLRPLGVVKELGIPDRGAVGEVQVRLGGQRGVQPGVDGQIAPGSSGQRTAMGVAQSGLEFDPVRPPFGGAGSGLDRVGCGLEGRADGQGESGAVSAKRPRMATAWIEVNLLDLLRPQRMAKGLGQQGGAKRDHEVGKGRTVGFRSSVPSPHPPIEGHNGLGVSAEATCAVSRQNGEFGPSVQRVAGEGRGLGAAQQQDAAPGTDGVADPLPKGRQGFGVHGDRGHGLRFRQGPSLGHGWTAGVGVQGLVEGAVDVDGPGRPCAGHLLQGRLGVRCPCGRPREEGPNVGGVNPGLHEGLAFPLIGGPCRPVCREADEREATAVGFGEGRRVVQCRRAARAGHRDGPPQGEGHAEGVVGRCPFVQGHDAANASIFQSLHQRGIPRPRTHHGTAQATGHEAFNQALSAGAGVVGMGHSGQ